MRGTESGFELARRRAAPDRDSGRAVILISTYSAADFAGPIAESLATGFLPKRELSADAIRRIVDGGPGCPPGAPARWNGVTPGSGAGAAFPRPPPGPYPGPWALRS